MDLFLKFNVTPMNQVQKRKLMTLTKKVLGTSELKTDYNTNITEIEGKLPSVVGLVATAPLNTVENKRPNVSYLVKKLNDCEESVKPL